MPIPGKHPPRRPVAGMIGLRQKRTLDIVEQLSRVAGGRGVTWTPFGPAFVPSGTSIKMGISPAGGISKISGSIVASGEVAEAQLDVTTPTSASFVSIPSTFT